jgi:hypothetical protein
MAGGTTGIAIITDLSIGIPDITIIIRDMTAIMAGITIMIATITGGIVGTTAGNGVRRRRLNSLFDKGGVPRYSRVHCTLRARP